MKLLIAALALFLAAGELPVAGGFRPVPAGDPAVAEALATATDLIHKDAALGGMDLASPEAVQVERQVVAGLNFRTTARVGSPDHRRAIRALVYRDLRHKVSLTSVELGPIGKADLSPGAGTVTGLPGGYQQQEASEPGMKKSAELACKLLGGPAWLGRGVMLSKLEGASTQVVSGLNTHLLFRGAVKGGERTFEVVLYEPAAGGAPELTWVKVSR